MLDGILRKLNEGNLFTQASTDDLVVFILGKFPATASELRQTAFIQNGLRANPNKLVLLINKKNWMISEPQLYLMLHYHNLEQLNYLGES